MVVQTIKYFFYINCGNGFKEEEGTKPSFNPLPFEMMQNNCNIFGHLMQSIEEQNH